MNLPALITSLQTANRHIEELQDTIHHWQIKYHQHFELQQQPWCNACRSRFDIKKDLELCPSCTRRLQKLNNLDCLSISRCPQVTTTSIVEEPSALMNTQNNAPKPMECTCMSSYHLNTTEADSSHPSLNKNSTKLNHT